MVQAAVLEGEGRARGEDSGARPLRLLALVPRVMGVSPGQRYRLEQWAPLLKERHGITVDFVPFESPGLSRILHKPAHTLQKAAWVSYDFSRRIGAVLKARRYDGAVVYREAALIGGAIYERLLTWLDVPLFFDFDDAIWREGDPGNSASGIFSRLHFWGKTATNCRIASGVLAGNAYLADYARQQNERVFIIPTGIDLTRYHVQSDLEQDEPFVIGWTGSTSTLIHFERARPVLERLAAQRKIAVTVICNTPPERPIAGAEYRFIPWTAENEGETVGECHVGIMPLPDEEFARGKCGLKALQYMSVGRPVVIAPVGVNADIVQHGENGYLATTDDEWLVALTRLADSRELRQRIGAAGRRTVEQHYSSDAVAAKVAAAVRQTLG